MESAKYIQNQIDEIENQRKQNEQFYDDNEKIYKKKLTK